MSSLIVRADVSDSEDSLFGEEALKKLDEEKEARKEKRADVSDSEDSLFGEEALKKLNEEKEAARKRPVVSDKLPGPSKDNQDFYRSRNLKEKRRRCCRDSECSLFWEETLKKFRKDMEEARERPVVSDELPGPSKDNQGFYRSRNLKGNDKLNLLKRKDSCFEGENYFKCKACGLKISNMLSFKRHESSHTKSNENFTEDTSEEEEIAIPGHFQCDKCLLSFSNTFMLSQHLQIHYRIIRGSRRCVVCEKVFINVFNRNRHVESKHLDLHLPEKSQIQRKPFFECDMCSMAFCRQISFSRHLQTHYDIVRNNQRCVVCKKVYSSVSSRNVHVKRKHLDLHLNY